MGPWLAKAVQFLLSVALAASWSVHAMAMDGITTADAIAIQDVVQSQFDALATDDAARAFDLATQEKRMLIGSPDNFMRLIKEAYQPIYRHHALIFSQPEVIDGEPIQVVRVADDENHVWVAVFWMRQEEDSSWKIDGCQLLQTESVSV